MADLFPVFFVLVVILGVGSTVYKVATARRMARNAGMDEDDAAAVALLGDPGLSTTYMVSTLRGGRRPADPAQPEPTAADRLRELQQLRDQGLITPDEHDARRRAIIDAL